MKILIITHEFPPLNTIGALRPYSWAKYWSRMGHDIKVITTKKEKFDGILNSEFDWSDLNAVEIEELEYLPSVFRPKTSLSPVQKNQVKEKQKFDFYSIIKTYSKYIRQLLGVGSLISIRDLWIPPAVKRALQIYQYWKFDCIVSTYGPPAPHIVAGIIKRKLNIFWLADYRDLWYQTHYLATKFPFSILQKEIENFIVSKADRITIVSDPLKERLRERFGNKVVTIPNGFDTEKKPKELHSIFQKDCKIRLAYTGKIRKYKQDLNPLFEAICRLKQQRLNLQSKLEVLFYGWQLEKVPSLIENYNLSDIVKLPGAVYREDALQIQRSVDALLFFDWEDDSVDGILTGKIFEYMYSGTPVLGIGASEKTAAGRLIQEAGIGICLGKSVEKIAKCIEKLLNHEEIYYSPSQEVLQQYTRESLAKKMLEQIIEYKN